MVWGVARRPGKVTTRSSASLRSSFDSAASFRALSLACHTARYFSDQPPPLNLKVPAARLSLMCPRAARRIQDPTLRAASHTPEVELAREKTVRVTGRATGPRTDEARIARTRGPMVREEQRTGRISSGVGSRFNLVFWRFLPLLDLKRRKSNFRQRPFHIRKLVFEPVA